MIAKLEKTLRTIPHIPAQHTMGQQQTCGPRGGSGPTPTGKSQSYRVPYQYWSGSHGKPQSYQDCIQCWTTIVPPAKRHLNGISLVGDGDPLLVVDYKNSVRARGPRLIKRSGSAHGIQHNHHHKSFYIIIFQNVIFTSSVLIGKLYAFWMKSTISIDFPRSTT